MPLEVHVPEPVDEVPFKETVLLLAQTIGEGPVFKIAGVLTVTEIVPIGPGQPPAVANTEYVPASRVEAPGILGFCVVDVNEFGPVQL